MAISPDIDIDTELEKIHLIAILKKAHRGDESCRDAYKSLIDAETNGYRKLWLFYLREYVMRELLEDYVARLELKLENLKCHKR